MRTPLPLETLAQREGEPLIACAPHLIDTLRTAPLIVYRDDLLRHILTALHNCGLYTPQQISVPLSQKLLGELTRRYIAHINAASGPQVEFYSKKALCEILSNAL